MAQGKSRREKEKMNIPIERWRERVKRSDGAGNASEREKEKRNISIER